MGRRSTQIIIIFVMIVCVITGCGQTGGDGGKNSTQTVGQNRDDSLFTIVTSFYPVYVATINVTKDVPGVEVKNMTKPQTGCLHDYALTPEDLKTLETADVFIVNGAGMESFLDNVIEQQKDLKLIVASEGIKLLKDEGGEENPHVWVSIKNTITYVNNIATQLSDADNANSDRYFKNAEEYIKKLEALQKEMYDALDELENRDIVTFHEAFPYFAEEFNFNVAEVIHREPGTEPTPKELAEIIDMVLESGVKALFAEPQYSSKAADAIARETGAKVYELDPVVTGKSDLNAYNAYIEAMKKNKEVLLEALR